MKIRTLILSAAVLATASGYAFAQVPSERTGSKTDTQQSHQQMQKDKMTKPSTTGSGMCGYGMSGSSSTNGSGATSDKANGQMLNKNVSPASPNAGEKQQK